MTLSGLIPLVLIIVFLFYVVLIIILISSELVIDKKNVKDRLSIAIKNGANVEVMNNFLKTQKRQRSYFPKYHTGNYYHTRVSLADVLIDLKSDEYEKEQIDSQFIDKINNAINEEKKKSPFDGLEEKQKDLFETIISLLDKQNFEKIQHNINKISNELALKTEESKKAKLNFKIAIFSIVITVMIGIYQIYDSNKTSFNLTNRLDCLSNIIEKKDLNTTSMSNQNGN